VGEDVRVLVERLTDRVATLEGTENFTARFKEQFAQALSAGDEFKKAVQGEISSWKAQQEAAQKPVDAKWVADNVPATGLKAEGTGLKVEGNAAAVNLFGGQFEYGLIKHEKTLIDVNKILENREQKQRDQIIDNRFADLARIDRNLRAAIGSAQDRITTTAKDVRRIARAADQQLRQQITALRTGLRTANRVAHSAERRSTRIETAVNRLARTQHTDDQRVRSQISALKTRISRISQVANDADQRSKSLRIKANNLDRQVRTGLQRVRELEDSARGAGRSIQGLRNDLNSLEQTLRR
jgi:chromosome segregation ATPase